MLGFRLAVRKHERHDYARALDSALVAAKISQIEGKSPQNLWPIGEGLRDI
jgi:hypothetical protein